jgi:trehalose 6-phosphate phosphatase
MASGAEPLQEGGLAAKAPVGSCGFFLDVDGTLLEIKPRPEEVASDEALRSLLRMLSDATGGALALISGRKIEDVDRIFAPLVLAAAGLHGAELRLPDGTRTFAERAIMDAARPILRDFASAREGVWVEDKGATLAVHFRQRPELEPEVLHFMRQLASDGLAVQEGKMVAELKEMRHDKGKAIEFLAGVPPFAGRRPVFIGDDVTDESGFQAVNALGGISIRIGPPNAPTKARYCLESPKALRRELGSLMPI